MHIGARFPNRPLLTLALAPTLTLTPNLTLTHNSLLLPLPHLLGPAADLHSPALVVRTVTAAHELTVGIIPREPALQIEFFNGLGRIRVKGRGWGWG